MKTIKQILVALIICADAIFANAQTELSRRQDVFMQEVLKWAKSADLNPTYDGTILDFSVESAKYSVSFIMEDNENGPYWLRISRVSKYGNEISNDLFKDRMFSEIQLYTPFKPSFDDNSYVLFIDVAYMNSDTFVNLLPYYVDYMEYIVDQYTKASSTSSTLDSLALDMVKVDGGSFIMGNVDDRQSEGALNVPAHKVVISTYWISKYEVTQELWCAVMNDNPSQMKGAGRPVENVSWEDVNEFINRLNQLTGCSYRLPTEAEWEYAARGGDASKGYAFPGGNDCAQVAWFQNNSFDETHDVGKLAPNELGLFDMGGNVSEWCSDWLGTYSSGTENNPVGPETGTQKVYRGGNWLSDEPSCDARCRRGASVGSKSGSRGFRLAMDGNKSPKAVNRVKENDANRLQSKLDDGKTEEQAPSILSYERVQVKPTFKGGTITKFAQWVEGMMADSNVSGKVSVEFTVNIYGGVRNVVVKGAGKKTNDKIMNIVKFSPNWTPGKNRGKVVPVRCRMTLSFGA